MILYIAEFTMPLLGLIALKEIYNNTISKEKVLNGLKWAAGITGGLCLVFLMFGGKLFSFVADVDHRYIAAGYPAEMFDAIRLDRQAMMRADSFRSLVYIILAAVTIFAFLQNKLKPAYFIVALGLLIIADMWTVNLRYLNAENFIPLSKVEKPFEKTNADKQILADKTLYFRVYNQTVSPFNDASTSFYHKSIGGYHGAKLRRYQELIDYHISRGNMDVLNMLNTRYIIERGEQGPVARFNPNALGNAWFVDSIKIVNNADEEIAALNGFNPSKIAIVDKRFSSTIGKFSSQPDENDTIYLTEYRANRLVYSYSLNQPRMAVFSEIHYPAGWMALVDGVEQEPIRVNYVLRGLLLPQGTSEVVFEFKPKMVKAGYGIDLVSSLLVLLATLGWLGYGIVKTWFSEN